MTNLFFEQTMKLLQANVENSCQSLALVQSQSEKIAKMMLEQGTNMQEQGKDFLQQWMDNMQQLQRTYQENMQQQLQKLQEFNKQ